MLNAVLFSVSAGEPGEEEHSWPHASLDGRLTVVILGEFDRVLTSGVPGGAVGVCVGVAIATAGIRLKRELCYFICLRNKKSITMSMIYCKRKERLFKNMMYAWYGIYAIDWRQLIH